MKKSLLLLGGVLMGLSASAATFPAVNGYTLTTLAENNVLSGKDWKALVNGDGSGAIPSLDFIATATCVGGKVYVGSSKVFVDGGLVEQGQLVVFNAETGAYEKNIQLTIDGQPLAGALCANVVGHDDFGNLYVGGYKGTMWISGETGEKASPLNVYLVDPATGALTLAAELCLTEDYRSLSARVDYFDVSGDITRQQAPCSVMAGGSKGAYPIVYGWYSEKGSAEWGPLMYSFEQEALALEETYPMVEKFDGGTTVNIIKDENFEALKFYVDDFTIRPSLYNNQGGMDDSFSAFVKDSLYTITPRLTPSGMTEFSFGDNIFGYYAVDEYTAPEQSNVRISLLGEGGVFETMTPLYTYGLGAEKGGGRRIHCLEADVITDGNGKYGAYLFTYKCGNGWARHLFAEEGFNGAGVSAVEVENNAPAVYYNLQGIRVANPENGLFIRRQGNKVSKVVL